MLQPDRKYPMLFGVCLESKPWPDVLLLYALRKFGLNCSEKLNVF
jgi:hypothetical protein